MNVLKRALKSAFRPMAAKIGVLSPRSTSVQFAGGSLSLNPAWKHERNYLAYVAEGRISGPLAMDVWALSHLVRAGDRVLDAGANIGFTALLASHAGAAEVHCFEPDPRAATRIREHCKGPTFVHREIALGDSEGQTAMVLSARHNQGSTLSTKIVERFPALFSGAERVNVQMNTVDALYPDVQFDFLKVDVEGFELETLRGAAGLFSRSPPRAVYLEAFDDFLDPVESFLAPYYRHAYRLACDARGWCRLFGSHEDVSSLERDGCFTQPPSYVFSNETLDHYAATWTPPVFTGR